MTSASDPAHGATGRGPWGTLRVLTAGVALLGLAVALSLALYFYPPPSPGALVLGGLGLTGILLLAVARYEAAVAAGFLLLVVVKFEPAPADLVFALLIAVAAVTGRFVLSRVPMIVLACLAMLIVLNLLSVMEAVDSARALSFLWISLYVAIFSVWLAGYVNSAHRARLIMVCYVTAAAISALFASLALFVHWPQVTLEGVPILPGSDQLTVYSGTRAAGWFKDPNVFGPFMIPAFLIVLEDMLRPRLIQTRQSLKFLILCMLGLGVLFSYSRAAWLTLGVGVVLLLAVLAFRKEGGGRLVAVLAVVLGTAALAGLAVSVTGSSEFLGQRAGVQSYDAQRFDAQRAGLELAQSHPIGIGPGQFEPVVQYASHNTYIRVFSEQGPAGLLALITLAFATLVFAARNAAAGRSTYGIGSAALLATWCGLLVSSFFIDTLHWRHLWVVAGLIWAGTMRRALPEPIPQADRRAMETRGSDPA